MYLDPLGDIFDPLGESQLARIVASRHLHRLNDEDGGETFWTGNMASKGPSTQTYIYIYMYVCIYIYTHIREYLPKSRIPILNLAALDTTYYGTFDPYG